MILVSLVLVVAAAITLALGFFQQDSLTFVYVSIVCAVLAGISLMIGVIRSRPARRPIPAGDREGGEREGKPVPAKAWASSAAITREDDDSAADIVATHQERAPDDAWVPPGADATSPLPQAVDRDVTSPIAPPASTPASWAPPAPAAPVAAGAAPPPTPAGVPAPAVAPAPPPAAPKAASSARWAPPPPPAAPRAPADDVIAARNDDPTARTEADRLGAVLATVVSAAQRDRLLAHFGTVRRLRAAPVERIAEAGGIDVATAQRVADALHR